MVAVQLYPYYKQGICACPIYIEAVINTYKVLISIEACRNDNPAPTPRFPKYV